MFLVCILTVWWVLSSGPYIAELEVGDYLEPVWNQFRTGIVLGFYFTWWKTQKKVRDWLRTSPGTTFLEKSHQWCVVTESQTGKCWKHSLFLKMSKPPLETRLEWSVCWKTANCAGGTDSGEITLLHILPNRFYPVSKKRSTFLQVVV